MANNKVIEGTDVTASQLKEFFSQVSAGAITRSLLQGFLEQAKKGLLATAIADTFLTSEYFVTRPGRYVSDDFTSLITSTYGGPIIPRGLAGVESFDLTNNSFDKTILARSEMGGEENVRKHAFTPDQIAALIDLKSEGTVGKLLTNGYANLFYVVGKDGVLFVVRVYWRAVDSGWFVFVLELDGGCRWIAGDRVFRNTRAFKSRR